MCISSIQPLHFGLCITLASALSQNKKKGPRWVLWMFKRALGPQKNAYMFANHMQSTWLEIGGATKLRL